MSARVEPRFTRDVDLAVLVEDDRHAETITREFLNRDYQLLATVEQETTGRLATIRLLPPGQSQEGIVVDVLFASSGIEPELTTAAQALEVFPGIIIPVASVAHLIALKLLSRNPARPQDKIDLVALLAVASEADLNAATQAINLITSRGANRGRDLSAILDKMIPH